MCICTSFLQKVALPTNLNIHKFKRCSSTRPPQNSQEVESQPIPLSPVKMVPYSNDSEESDGEMVGPRGVSTGAYKNR